MMNQETAAALARLKRKELRDLSDEEALRATDMLLSMPPSLVWRSAKRQESQGLLERQRLLYGPEKRP